MIHFDLEEWMEGVKEINKELNAGRPSLTELVNRQIESASKVESNDPTHSRTSKASRKEL